jgi:hypothetical protein
MVLSLVFVVRDKGSCFDLVQECTVGKEEVSCSFKGVLATTVVLEEKHTALMKLISELLLSFFIDNDEDVSPNDHPVKTPELARHYGPSSRKVRGISTILKKSSLFLGSEGYILLDLLDHAGVVVLGKYLLNVVDERLHWMSEIPRKLIVLAAVSMNEGDT